MLCDKAVTLTCIRGICRHFSIAMIPGTCIHRERVWQSHVLGVPPPHIAHSISLSGKQNLCTAQCSLVPRLLCGGGGKRAWYTLFAHAPGSLGNLHTTPLYTKITVNFCLPPERPHCIVTVYTPCGTHTSDFEVKNNIALMVTVCIASFEVIGKLQRERLRQSRAKVFS